MELYRYPLSCMTAKTFLLQSEITENADCRNEILTTSCLIHTMESKKSLQHTRRIKYIYLKRGTHPQQFHGHVQRMETKGYEKYISGPYH